MVREQPVEERRSSAADVKKACRGGGEASNDRHQFVLEGDRVGRSQKLLLAYLAGYASGNDSDAASRYGTCDGNESLSRSRIFSVSRGVLDI